MNPIVSPLWFYLIGVVTNLKMFLGIVSWILLVPCIFTIFFFVLESIEEGFKTLKTLRKFIFLGLLCLFVNYAIPAETTCYQMIAASMITPNNIEAVGTVTENVVDYIIDNADKLLESSEEEKDKED